MIRVQIIWSKRKDKGNKVTSEFRDFDDEQAARKFIHNNPLCLSVQWNENPGGISGISPQLRRNEQTGAIDYYSWSNCE